MSWFTDATAWLGITDATTAQSIQNRAVDASASAAKAANRANELTDEQLAFERQRYDDWTATYGDFEQNMADYYKDLSVEDYQAQGTQNIQQSMQRATENIRTTLAQRGISGSGLEAAATTATEIQGATEKARVRAEAPQKVAEAKMGFLQMGLNKEANLLGTMAQTSATGVSAATSLAGQQSSLQGSLINTATNQNIANQQSIVDVIGTTAGIIV